MLRVILYVRRLYLRAAQNGRRFSRRFRLTLDMLAVVEVVLDVPTIFLLFYVQNKPSTTYLRRFRK